MRRYQPAERRQAAGRAEQGTAQQARRRAVVGVERGDQAGGEVERHRGAAVRLLDASTGLALGNRRSVGVRPTAIVTDATAPSARPTSERPLQTSPCAAPPSAATSTIPSASQSTSVIALG